LSKAYDIEIRWSAFPLHPETPQEGKTLAELFAERNVDIPRMVAHLREVAAQLGLPFGERVMTFNSRMAQELGKWAETKGRGADYHEAIFRAYFADGWNIAETETLVSICRSLALDGDEARAVIVDRSFREEVDRDWQRSSQLGITAVPTFLLDGFSVVGAKPYDKLAQLLDMRQVPRRTPGG
jgi:predicted DsbA family dithiol-disulfide isomerase